MIETWESDSLSVRVMVTDEAGAPLDLSAASVEAVAEVSSSGMTVEAACIIEDVVGGVLRVEFPARALPAGNHVFQVRVAIGAEVQTVVSETLRSRHSVEAAA